MPNASQSLWAVCVQPVQSQRVGSVQNMVLSHTAITGPQTMSISRRFIRVFSRVLHTFCAQLFTPVLSVMGGLSTVYTGPITSPTKYMKGKN